MSLKRTTSSKTLDHAKKKDPLKKTYKRLLRKNFLGIMLMRRMMKLLMDKMMTKLNRQFKRMKKIRKKALNLQLKN